MEMVNIKINNMPVAVAPGTTILEAAHQALDDNPKTGAALPIGAGVLALLSAGAFLAFRKKKA